jgi:DNA-binding beta-propeller fold protein YncE
MEVSADHRVRARLIIATGVASIAAILSVGAMLLSSGQAVAQADVRAPKFEVDPLWPKPLPNNWILGSVIGVSVDADNHIWIIHRGSSTLAAKEKLLESKGGDCCAAAPPILEFDQAGNLLRHWGGPGKGYDWPDSNHGITIDYKGNVWIGGNGPGDSQILKFTKDGKFLMQVGKAGARRSAAAGGGDAGAEGAGGKHVGDSNDPVSFGRVAKIFVDPKTNEAYVADGYLNKRVAVIDADTGKLKRYWGAYGNRPDDAPLGRYDPSAPPAQQFRNPVHCAEMSVDRLLYVCDRVANRLQVFTPEGKFVKEAFYDKNTLGDGSVWDLAFSKDPQQRYIFLADGSNNNVKVIDRQSLTVLTQFGGGGRVPSAFYAVHSIAIDSKGNLYTTETYEGKRVQRFVYKGIDTVARRQGLVWPTRH